MNILMLGNGFDLYYQLPTKYINFIHTFNFLHTYYTDHIPNNIGMIFGDKRLQTIDNDIKESFEKYKMLYQSQRINNYDYIMIQSLKNNYWFKYFLQCCPNSLTWIDFEKEINIVIDSFFDFFNNNNFNFDAAIAFIPSSTRKNNYIVTFFDYFFNKNKILVRDGKNIYEAYPIIDDFLKQNPEGSEIFEIDEEKIIDFLYKQLEELSVGLFLYLSIFINCLTKNDFFKTEIKKKLLFTSVDKVITFNYTNTYESIYNCNECIHIHGDLKSKIVLGINPTDFDEKNKIDTRFIRFKKYYQRIIYKTDKLYNKLKIELLKNNRYDNEQNTLIIFGHSLDKTDEDVIKDLFNVSSKIVIYYYNESALESLVKNLISIYGKAEFDDIRFRKDIDFLPID